MRWNRRRSRLYGTPSPPMSDLEALRSALQELLADRSPFDPCAPGILRSASSLECAGLASRRCPTRPTELQLSLLVQGDSLRSPHAARPGAGPRWWQIRDRKSSSAMGTARLERCLRRGIGRHREGGGAVAECWPLGVRVGWLPSRPPSTQAEPSRRGPGRPGRSYSGALHLDALNHAPSTMCGSTADGEGEGQGGTNAGCAKSVGLRSDWGLHRMT